jgi:signal transduction histidine kinase/ActR/RegA family two-component response regulator
VLPKGDLRWIAAIGKSTSDDTGRPVRMSGICLDITDRKRAEQQVIATTQRLQALMETLPVGVSFSEDRSCQRISGNATLLAQFDMTPEDNVSASAPEPQAAGHRVRYLHEGRELSDAELPLQRAAAEGRSVPPMELEIHLPSGRRWFAEASGAPLRDEQGRVVAGLAVVVDVTARRQAEESLREANRRKDEFLAMLAHELRNPLTPIRNAVHIMGLLDLHHPRLRWVQETIDLQLRHLTRLVDDLMDVSRFMRGKITLSNEVLDAASVMDNAVATLLPVIEGRGQQLTVRLPLERIWLNADRIRLTQVLTNLLDNASKFSADGGHIALAAEAAGNEVAIRVHDDGRGIAPALLPHVFDLFRQGDTSLDRPTGGLGIGLTLAQQLVRLQGGRIEAASAGVGQGSTFTVRLPIAAPATTAAPEPAHASLRAATPVRVLVVDDDAGVADSTRVWLEMTGYDPRIARSGPDALELVATFRPQVVLLDIGLAGLDGYQTAQRLRGLPGGDEVLLIAVTGYGDDEAVARFHAAGFDHHLVKPFDPKALLRLLSRRGTDAPDPA